MDIGERTTSLTMCVSVALVLIRAQPKPTKTIKRTVSVPSGNSVPAVTLGPCAPSVTQARLTTPHYMAWSSGKCESCGNGASHAPTIALACGVVTFFLLVAVVLGVKRKAITTTITYQRIPKAYKVGQVKISTMVFTCQVLFILNPSLPLARFFSNRYRSHPQIISQFASVVTSTRASSDSSSGGHPSSATTFAAGLGLSNLDLVAFVPVRCVFPATTYYGTLVFSTVAPLAVIALLWAFPISQRVIGRRAANAERFVARLSLLVLEVVVSSVSTTIVRALSCEDFDNGSFLSVQLTLQCDASTKRKLYVAYRSALLVGVGADSWRVLCHVRELGLRNTSDHPVFAAISC